MHIIYYSDAILEQYLLLNSAMSTEERQKRAVYISQVIRIRKRMIGRASHVQSQLCTFNRPILWSAILSIFLQHLLYLYKSRILMQNITQDPLRLRRTTVALNSASFERVLFHLRLFWQEFTNILALLFVCPL